MPGRGEVRGTPTFRVLKTDEAVMPTRLAFGGAPPEQLATVLGPDLLEGGRVGTVYMCVLLETASGLVLLDTGPPAEQDGGRAPLLPLLDELRISPSEITLVVLSHAHEDHLGGLLDQGVPVFAEAEHVLAEEEWRFWQAGDDAHGLPEEMYHAMRDSALTHLGPVNDAGLLRLVTGEVTPRPGIRVVPAPGHTPGHMAVEVTTRTPGLLYIGDAWLHEAMVSNPGLTGLVDADAEATIATRHALMSRAESSGADIAGGHLRRTGPIERHAGGYRWS